MPGRGKARGADGIAWLEAGGLALLSIVMHILVLRGLYPGHYDPFWPFNSDYYLAPALSQSPMGPGDFLSSPRPLGIGYFALLGHLGIRGAMVVEWLVAVMAPVVTTMVLRRLLQWPVDVVLLCAHALFSYLVFAHPFHFQFASYDTFSQLSWVLLGCASLAIISGRRLWCYALLAMAAMLVKETYALAALLFAAAWWRWPGPSRSRSLLPFGVILTALGAALLINHAIGSPFTGAANVAGSPYRIDLSPRSVIDELLRYIGEGFNLEAGVFVLATLAICLCTGAGRSKPAVLLLPLAAVLALLPNAILPNHHDPGYSYNAACLAFAPVVVASRAWQARGWSRPALIVLALCALALPLSWQSRYAAQSWGLAQQQRQKRLVIALQGRCAALANAPGAVLVSGLTFPFTPFDHGYAMKSLTGCENATFDVIAYTPRAGGVAAIPRLDALPGPVTYVEAPGLDPTPYRVTWLFREDGSLVDPVTTGVPHPSLSAWLSRADLIRYPRLGDVFKPQLEAIGAAAPDGWQYLHCAEAMLAYDAPRLAEICARRSIELVPENAYVHYFQALVLERQANLPDAITEMRRALELDDTLHPNPAFRSALDRLLERSHGSSGTSTHPQEK